MHQETFAEREERIRDAFMPRGTEMPKPQRLDPPKDIPIDIAALMDDPAFQAGVRYAHSQFSELLGKTAASYQKDARVSKAAKGAVKVLVALRKHIDDTSPR